VSWYGCTTQTLILRHSAISVSPALQRALAQLHQAGRPGLADAEAMRLAHRYVEPGIFVRQEKPAVCSIKLGASYCYLS
jgi:hypothetical protein